ncbi:hypothetical protein D5S18_25645 [Nocardia panacis]|uniref:Uncharacterized protein n=2 Tax=Nocardia panacis TaxID=2340916 RepID=A0A3A4KDN4_9NOCA|nr:hypothetical protein D5S18_25645 [Nocardia panacis]
MLRELDVLTAVTARDTDSLVRQLHIDAVANEFEARELADRTREVAELRDNLESRLDYLRTEIISANYRLAT